MFSVTDTSTVEQTMRQDLDKYFFEMALRVRVIYVMSHILCLGVLCVFDCFCLFIAVFLLLLICFGMILSRMQLFSAFSWPRSVLKA